MVLEADMLNGIRIAVGPIESAVEENNDRPCKPQQKTKLKEFKLRNSFLIDLYKISHIKTIYNICIASFILQFVNIVVNDLVNFQMIKLNIGMIIWNLDGIEIMLLIWFSMLAFFMVLYAGFVLWMRIRNDFAPSKWPLILWDNFWMCAYIMYLLAFFSIPAIFVLRSRLTPIISGVLIFEQVRLMMKSHAFVKSNLHKTTKAESETSAEPNTNSDYPTITKFLYFHFAPTLVYRDKYPRNEEINFKRVIWHLCEVLGILFFAITLNEQFVFPHLRSFWDEPATAIRVITLFFRLLFPGLIMLIFGFYLFFHSWLNAFAEVLSFGDRLFYEDWWTTTTFATYYRSWNVVVHDWMFEYMYQDMARVLTSSFKDKKSSSKSSKSYRFISKMLSFLISAAVHEYLIIVSMRFFYPLLFILFGIVGVTLMYLPKNKGAPGNIFMWICLSVGCTLLLTGYCLEYFARRHCTPYPNVMLDFFIPRSWTCNMTAVKNS